MCNYYFNKQNFFTNKTKEKLIGLFIIILSVILIILFSYWIIYSKIKSTIIISKLIKNNNITRFDIINIYMYEIANFIENDKVVCLGIPSLLSFTFVLLYFKYIAINYFIRVG